MKVLAWVIEGTEWGPGGRNLLNEREVDYFNKDVNALAPGTQLAAVPTEKELEAIQAEIHKRIKPLLTRRQQGNVMHHVRAVLAETLKAEE